MGSTSRILPFVPSSLQVAGYENIKLADSGLFKDAKSEEEKEKQLKCIRFFNSTFPLLVPKAQHDLDMASFSTGEGNYWGHAMYFLLCSKAHGFPLWKKFQEQIRLRGEDLCKPHISASTLNKYFKHLDGFSAIKGLELRRLCLNKAVLVQLPFQPTLLLQWLSAALHIVMNFEEFMSPFYKFPVPAEHKPDVLLVHRLLISSHRCIGFLFDYLQRQVESENEIFVGHLKTFEKFLSRIVIFLRFSCEQSNLHCLARLKANCFESWRRNQRQYQLKKAGFSLKERNYIYNLDFWKSPCRDRKIFGSSYEKLVRRKHSVEEEPTFQEIKDVLNNEDVSIDTTDSEIAYLQQNAGFVRSIQEFLQAEREMRSTCIKIDERGMIGSLISNAVAGSYVDAIHEISNWVAKILDEAPASFLCYTKPPQTQGLGSIREFSTKLEQYPFSFERLIEVLTRQANCKLPGNVEAEKYSLFAQFQAEIASIHMECIKDQLNIQIFEEEKDERLRDYQVAQYLIPCFFRSFADIGRLNPPINETVKFWYLHFVTKLIDSYGARKSSWTNIKKDIDENSILRDNAELLKFFQDVTNTFNAKLFSDKENIGRYAKFCPSLKMLYEVLANSSGHDDDLASEPCVYWNWLMWDFFGNIKHAILMANLKVEERNSTGH